jgi:hypothetical protein
MDLPVNPDERDPSVVAVATVSLVAGLACTLTPAGTARFAGIDATPGVLRRPVGSGRGAGRVSGAAVLAVAAGPRRLEPGDRRGVAGVDPVTTRPSARCRFGGGYRLLRTAARLRAPHR